MYQKIKLQKAIQVFSSNLENKLLIELIKNYNELYDKIMQLNNYIKIADKIINKKNATLICDNAALNDIETSYKQSRIIDDEEYKNALILKERFPQLSEKGEIRRKELLNNIENVLKKGGNPNLPETVSIRHHSEGKISVKIHPLHMAIDSDLTTLLLKYGADQNISGYVASMPNDNYTTSYFCIWDNITALEAACLRHKYDKVKVLLSAPYEIKIEKIEKSLSIILHCIDEPYESYYQPYGMHNLVEIIRSEAYDLYALELIRKLSEKSSERFLTKLLDSELKHEKRALGIINSIPEQRRFRSKEFDWYKLIKNKIDIYTHCLTQKLTFPIWLVLSLGQSQKGNDLNNFPIEIVKLITFKLLQTDICEMPIARLHADKLAEENGNKLVKENAKKVDVFKKIYTILLKYNCSTESSQFLDKTTEKTSNEVISLIESEFCRDGSSLIVKAWELSVMHFDNFSDKNDYLVQALTIWAAQNNQAYNALSASIYKLSIFEPTSEKHLLLIKKNIINDINVLKTINKGNPPIFI